MGVADWRVRCSVCRVAIYLGERLHCSLRGTRTVKLSLKHINRLFFSTKMFLSTVNKQFVTNAVRDTYARRLLRKFLSSCVSSFNIVQCHVARRGGVRRCPVVAIFSWGFTMN